MEHYTIVSCGPVPMHPRLIQCSQGTSRGRGVKSTIFGESSDFWYGPWGWYRGVEDIYMNRGD
jgi:hypothetical protein